MTKVGVVRGRMRSFYALAATALIVFVACGDEPRKKNNDDDDDGGGGSAAMTGGGGNVGAGGNPSSSSTNVGGAAGVGGSAGGTPTVCENAIDCGPAGSAICNPKTAMCGAPECDAEVQDCLDDDVCLTQGDQGTAGACYNDCVPYGNGCGPNNECVDLAVGQLGACMKTGPAQKDQTCIQSDLSTGCGPNMRCLLDENMASKCYDTCNFWGSAGACAATGELCDYRGFCLPPVAAGTIDPAAVGVACGPDPALCGVVGDKVSGVCLDAGNGPECLAFCRDATDCNNGDTCYDIGVPNVGACAP